jgi:hypothetical protein
MNYPYLWSIPLQVTILSCNPDGFGNTIVKASIGGTQLPDITILNVVVSAAAGGAGFADIQGRVQSLIMSCIKDGIDAVR